MSIVKPTLPRLRLSHPLAQGLVLACPFYEGSGLSVDDASGYQNPGTIAHGTNPGSWQGTSTGWGYNLGSTAGSPSSGDKITIGPNTGLEPTTALTIALGFTIAQTNQQSFLVAQDEPGSTHKGYQVYAFSDGNMYFNLGNGSVRTQNSAGPYVAGWNHVVAVWDGSNMFIYIAGVGNTPTAFTGPIAYTTSNAVILGGDSVTGNYSVGTTMDSVLVWNRALSSTEIRWLYEDPFAPVRLRRAGFLRPQFPTYLFERRRKKNMPIYKTVTVARTHTAVVPAAPAPPAALVPARAAIRQARTFYPRASARLPAALVQGGAAPATPLWTYAQGGAGWSYAQGGASLPP